MTRLFPHPFLSLLVFLVWTMLTGFSPGHLLLGGLVALAGGQIGSLLGLERPRIRIGYALVKLAGIVLFDSLKSNIAVARIVLFRPPARRSGFIHVPLDMRSPHGLALLAVILTAIPGTLWVQHDARRNVILLHVLDLDGEAAWDAFVKARYESLLMEIFE